MLSQSLFKNVIWLKHSVCSLKKKSLTQKICFPQILYSRRTEHTYILFFLPLWLHMKTGDKRGRTAAYSLWGWKLSLQLTWLPLIDSIHLSALSLVAAPRACSHSALRLFSETQVSRSVFDWERAETQWQTPPCYRPLTVFTSDKLTQTWQGDKISCPEPEPSRRNWDLHQTHTHTHAHTHTERQRER